MTFNIKHLIHFKPADVQIFFLSEIDDCYADPIVIDIDQPVRQLETDACAHRVFTFTNCEALRLLDLMHKRMMDQARRLWDSLWDHPFCYFDFLFLQRVYSLYSLYRLISGIDVDFQMEDGRWSVYREQKFFATRSKIEDGTKDPCIPSKWKIDVDLYTENRISLHPAPKGRLNNRYLHFAPIGRWMLICIHKKSLYLQMKEKRRRSLHFDSI